MNAMIPASIKHNCSMFPSSGFRCLPGKHLSSFQHLWTNLCSEATIPHIIRNSYIHRIGQSKMQLHVKRQNLSCRCNWTCLQNVVKRSFRAPLEMRAATCLLLCLPIQFQTNAKILCVATKFVRSFHFWTVYSSSILRSTIYLQVNGKMHCTATQFTVRAFIKNLAHSEQWCCFTF